MNHLERFFATIERREVDRPASWLGIPALESEHKLFEHFKISSINELKRLIDDDVYTVEIPYHSPVSDNITTAFAFSEKDSQETDFDRTLTTPGFFADSTDPSDVDKFDWPDPEKYISISECKKIVDEIPQGYAVMGVIWSAHFQDTCAAFGMENALMKMLTDPEVFEAVSNRIVDFYLKANEIFYEATKGKIHAILIGNDLGSQLNLMISPNAVRQFVLPGTRKLVEQAKSYGLKVVHHSCGAISEIIDDLIDCGIDVIHPIQALAKGMEPEVLKNRFGSRVTFCGGVDAQNLLISGSEEEVTNKVHELKKLFPTGLIISPSHEAILPDTKPSNIEALFKAVK
jgi:uroporphyrinogen decarboxylase